MDGLVERICTTFKWFAYSIQVKAYTVFMIYTYLHADSFGIQQNK